MAQRIDSLAWKKGNGCRSSCQRFSKRYVDISHSQRDMKRYVRRDQQQSKVKKDENKCRSSRKRYPPRYRSSWAGQTKGIYKHIIVTQDHSPRLLPIRKQLDPRHRWILKDILRSNTWRPSAFCPISSWTYLQEVPFENLLLESREAHCIPDRPHSLFGW